MDAILQLLSIWHKLFSGNKDLLFMFFEFYSKLEEKGIVFPPAYDSKYKNLSGNQLLIT